MPDLNQEINFGRFAAKEGLINNNQLLGVLRDFKKERESKTGSQVSRKSPFGLPDHLGEYESLINALRQAVLESDLSPHDKRDMEQYLESLHQQNYPLNIQKESTR